MPVDTAPKMGGVKLHDLKNDVVKTESIVCMTSVCASREQVAGPQCSTSPPPLSLFALKGPCVQGAISHLLSFMSPPDFAASISDAISPRLV